jgi:hypothetical protein
MLKLRFHSRTLTDATRYHLELALESLNAVTEKEFLKPFDSRRMIDQSEQSGLRFYLVGTATRDAPDATIIALDASGKFLLPSVIESDFNLLCDLLSITEPQDKQQLRKMLSPEVSLRGVGDRDQFFNPD